MFETGDMAADWEAEEAARQAITPPRPKPSKQPGLVENIFDGDILEAVAREGVGI